jgi:hypothetical protein
MTHPPQTRGAQGSNSYRRWPESAKGDNVAANAATAASSTRAFLSYTRLDDEFFGGSITALRGLIELGVKVVTGDRNFSIFQDVDGIELGQKWQKRLDEAILESSLLIPIVTPLFITSDPCRDELDKFIKHEKSLGADNRILPIYFQTASSLEKPELSTDDALVREIAERQRYDWRPHADLPANDPQIRSAVRKLATSIASALPQISTISPQQESSPNDRAFEGLVDDYKAGSSPVRNNSVVLWVDDRPDNNRIERMSMAPYGIEFVITTTTDEALSKLRGRKFDAVISDMGRPGDAEAGLTLLEAMRKRGDQTACFFYTTPKSSAFTKNVINRGAQGVTYRGDQLLDMLLQQLGVNPP